MRSLVADIFHSLSRNKLQGVLTKFVVLRTHQLGGSAPRDGRKIIRRSAAPVAAASVIRRRPVTAADRGCRGPRVHSPRGYRTLARLNAALDGEIAEEPPRANPNVRVSPSASVMEVSKATVGPRYRRCAVRRPMRRVPHPRAQQRQRQTGRFPRPRRMARSRRGYSPPASDSRSIAPLGVRP